MSGQRLDDIEGDAVDTQNRTTSLGVLNEERSLADDLGGRFGLDDDGRRLEGDADPTVEPFVCQREVLKPEVKPGADIDANAH